MGSGNHSSRTTVARRLKQPTREHRPGRPTCVPLFGLAPGGVYLLQRVSTRIVSSYLTLFTLTHLRLTFAPVRLAAPRATVGYGGRYSLCGTFPRVTPGRH
jgi:hypothetical protein